MVQGLNKSEVFLPYFGAVEAKTVSKCVIFTMSYQLKNYIFKLQPPSDACLHHPKLSVTWAAILL